MPAAVGVGELGAWRAPNQHIALWQGCGIEIENVCLKDLCLWVVLAMGLDRGAPDVETGLNVNADLLESLSETSASTEQVDGRQSGHEDRISSLDLNPIHP